MADGLDVVTDNDNDTSNADDVEGSPTPKTAEKRAADAEIESEKTPKRRFILADIEEPEGSSWSLDEDL